MLNIYLDDVRDAPSGFMIVRDVPMLRYIMSTNQEDIGILSLDHDMGLAHGFRDLIAEQINPSRDKSLATSGYEFLLWLEQEVEDNPDFILPQQILVHSSNSVGRAKMETVIKNLYLKR